MLLEEGGQLQAEKPRQAAHTRMWHPRSHSVHITGLGRAKLEWNGDQVNQAGFRGDSQEKHTRTWALRVDQLLTWGRGTDIGILLEADNRPVVQL